MNTEEFTPNSLTKMGELLIALGEDKKFLFRGYHERTREHNDLLEKYNIAAKANHDLAKALKESQTQLTEMDNVHKKRTNDLVEAAAKIIKLEEQIEELEEYKKMAINEVTRLNKIIEVNRGSADQAVKLVEEQKAFIADLKKEVTSLREDIKI